MLEARGERFGGRARGRELLDLMWRDAAVKVGATLFQPAEVTDLWRRDDDLVCVLADEREIAARLVIAACGSWNGKGVFAVPGDDAAPPDLFAFKTPFACNSLPTGLRPPWSFHGGYRW